MTPLVYYYEFNFLRRVLKVCPVSEQAIKHRLCGIVTMSILLQRSQKTNFYFLLCKECYWCASSVNLVNNRIIKCPSCNDACIKLIPIFKNETYRIGYSEKCGSTTEFRIKYTEESCGGLKNKVY